MDQLAEAGVTWWQMLPTHPTSGGPGYSPYSSPSAFALSSLLISPEDLVETGLLEKREVARAKISGAGYLVDYEAATAVREGLLEKAYRAFRSGSKSGGGGQYARFKKDEAGWLDEWALFAAIRSTVNMVGWTDWSKDLAAHQASAIERFAAEHAELIEYQKFIQFIADQQWNALRAYANQRGVGLIGDVPIFVSHDSADVWANRRLFTLDASGKAKFISGAPPDHFAKKGQKWGHPQYDWAAHKRSGYAWWTARFMRMHALFDCVRIDHFLGFYRAWVIDGDAKDARNGKWKLTPGNEVFEALTAKVGPKPPIIAEDLGVPADGATSLRERFHIPGMRVLQFGFGASHEHLPFSYVPNCVAYTGTHDNETSLEFYQRISKSYPGEKAKALALGITEDEPVWRMIEFVASSVANTAIFPVQDLLQLGKEHRMNTPGTIKDNWRWKLPRPIAPAVLKRFRSLLEATGRVSQHVTETTHFSPRKKKR